MQLIDSEDYILEKEVKSIYWGILLFFLTITVFFILPFITNELIIQLVAKAIVGVAHLGLIFYGQSLVKKLNRNYSVWSILLFFFTSFSLIVLGCLTKIKKELVIIKLDPENADENVNNLPSLTLGTDSNLLLEAVTNNSFTLNYMIANYNLYIQENSVLFPVLAAYTLNERKVQLSKEAKMSLNKFAQEMGVDSFDNLLDYFKTLSPLEISRISLEI